MKKQLIYIILGAVTLLGTVSCDLLEVLPGQEVSSGVALNTREGIEAATMGVYARLRSTAQYGRNLIVYPEIMSNTGAHSGTSSNFLNHSRNARNSHMAPWITGYQAISQINAIFEALEPFEADERWKKSVAGQLHFLRALFYHNLARVYGYDPSAIGSNNRGSVPLVLVAFNDWNEIRGVSRASHDEMYNFIYDELDKAYEYLSETTLNSRAPQFATAGAAAALFSRVALYRGDWARVVIEAEKALDSGIGRLSTVASYHADWRVAFHPESFFEVEFMPADNLGPTNSIRVAFTNRIDESSDVPNGNGYVIVSDQLWADLTRENNENALPTPIRDVRGSLVFYGADRESDKLQMTKFFSRSGPVNLDNVPVIRLSEVYLNRAEAYANMIGMMSESMVDINVIRANRGLPPVSGLSDDALLEEVWMQRRLELAFEGHSWFDYKRTRRNIPKPTGTTFSWTDYRILAGFPLREVAMHADVRNNSGY